MLPTEVLVNILQWLERRYLDAALFASRSLDSLIAAHFNELALRPIAEMLIEEGPRIGVRVKFTAENAARIQREKRTTLDRLGSVLPSIFVYRLNFDASVTEAVFSALQPHVELLRNFSFLAPRENTTEDIARRCWNDLFLFREIEVDCIKVNGRLQRGVISSWCATRSIQHSELFHHKGYHAFDSTFDKDFRDLVGLLNREGTKKTFTLKAEYRSFFEQLPSLLQQAFVDATTPAEYRFTLILYKPYRRDHHGECIDRTAWTKVGRIVNDTTKEEFLHGEPERYTQKRFLYLRIIFHRRAIDNNHR